MRITRVYTRTGDKGMTGLAGKRRVRKDHPRIEAIGTVDELNAVLGLARAYINDAKRIPFQARNLDAELSHIQNRLFDIGASLALVSTGKVRSVSRFSADEPKLLENAINRLQKDLGPLREFILPGGGKVSATLHLARTICRRAERRCVLLNSKERLDSEVLKYLNRLSDALFVFARRAASVYRQPEIFWKSIKH